MTFSDPDRSPASTPAEDGQKDTGGNDRDGARPSATGRGGFRRVGLLALATLVGAAIGALALYGMNGGSGNAPALQNSAGPHASSGASPAQQAVPAGRCTAAAEQAASLAPILTGDMARMQLARAPRPLPPLSFTGPDGKALTLDDFRGRVVLINLWATWCAPCRHEMPSLDRLQAELGGKDFEVVAINLDARDMSRPRAFLEEVKAQRLGLYVDSQTQSFQALRSVGRGFGLPSTLLVDKEGCELGFLAGPADWSGPAAVALMRAAMGGSSHSGDRQ